MKRFTLFFIAFLAVLLVSCVTPTPTVSPLPTPTPFPSPLISSGDVAIPEQPIFGGGQMEVPALVGVVQLIAAGAVGGIISFLFERFRWFQKITGDQRWWLIFCLSVGLPLLAQIALQFVPADVWTVLEPYWHSVALGFVGWLGTQVTHKKLNDKK